MARSRTDFHGILTNSCSGLPVYFQPPSGEKMQYPCVVYSVDSRTSNFANDARYRSKTGYKVTIISRDPDSPIGERLLDLPYSSFEREFTNDGLRHSVYKIYF